MSAPTYQTKLFINNEFVDAVSGKTFPVFNPSTGEKIVEVAEGDKADIDKAVAAARKAFQTWRNVNPSKRADYLHKIASLIQEHADEFANLETLNMGKPITLAQDDIDACVSTFKYYAGWADKIEGKTIPVESGYFAFTTYEPVGVCGQIIPWNYPMLMLAWKIAPAIAAGNTVVLKPAEQTPLSALRFAELVKKAGFPAGVINIVNGFGKTAGNALTYHMDVDKCAFTGSTNVGRLILKASAESNMKRITLELGGKSPLLIFNDANLDLALQYAYSGIFSNSGQVCCASSRVLVQEGIYDKFVEQISEMAKNRIVGNPFDEITEQGPLASEEHFNRVMNYISIGKKEGAKVVAGGDRIGDKGYFVQPTVFADVSPDMQIAREEIFGPCLSIIKFSTVEDGIKKAHKTIYGLAAGLFSENINQAMSVAQALRAGTVWVNCFDAGGAASTPFGGFKQSGFGGRELGEEGIKPYVEVKTTIVRVPRYTGPLEDISK